MLGCSPDGDSRAPRRLGEPTVKRNIDTSDPEIRDRLRTLREKANLTKAELAERAGMTFRTVHDRSVHRGDTDCSFLSDW